jgi:small GTP-binding protein
LYLQDEQRWRHFCKQRGTFHRMSLTWRAEYIRYWGYPGPLLLSPPPPKPSFFRTLKAYFTAPSARRALPAPRHYLMVGLDAAGKTTLLYLLANKAPVITTIPTIGFNVESLELQDARFTCWDVGGGDKIYPLWRHYYTDVVGMIFVVDSCDYERFEYAREELFKFAAEPQLLNVPVLLVCNKQDGGHYPAKSVEEIVTAMEMTKLNRPWHAVPASVGHQSKAAQRTLPDLSWLFERR